jgi:hypothetical protein
MPTIDVKKAVKIASQYINGLYGDGSIGNIRLEEVEANEDEDIWLVTVSFVDIDDLVPDRIYKTFEIDSETGQVFAMRIRDV